jgi:hypothetical protein
MGIDPGLRPRLAAAVERRHDAPRNTDGLNEEVFDALVLLAAGSWELDDLATGHGTNPGLRTAELAKMTLLIWVSCFTALPGPGAIVESSVVARPPGVKFHGVASWGRLSCSFLVPLRFGRALKHCLTSITCFLLTVGVGLATISRC